MIRADGSPKYTMKCMMTGAVINLILDPVFIFGLNMGVVGAGIATVIGEVAAGVLCLLYLGRLQTVHLTRESLRPTWSLTLRILKLGFPSLLTQALTALVQIILNNLMRVYGAVSVYGSDIALSVYGMMMKVYHIAHSMFVGVSAALLPALHDGIFPVWATHDHGVFLSGHWEADQLSIDPTGPTRPPAHSTGLAPVLLLGLGRCAFCRTGCRCLD